MIHTFEQGSEAWHAIRAGKFTGTRFAKVVSKIDSLGYKDLITDIAGEIITGELEESYSNATMARGKEFEPVAREVYCQEMDVEINEVGFYEMEGYEEWVGVSPDGVGEGLLEIKCPLRKTHLKYIEKNTLPNEYKWQVQGSLMVTGLPYCDFMSYYPAMKPFIIRVFPDTEMHKELIGRIEKAIKEITQKVSNYEAYSFDLS